MVKKAGSMDARGAWQVRPRWRITRADQIALGPGKADLLEAIQRCHAITRAAAEIGMSYRRAWLLVAEMNASFVEPLVETSRWRGEGATLTPTGRRALRLYRLLESRSLTALRGPIDQIRALLCGPAARKRRP
ncbi:MAG TPA: LysR family transcriptional regulator [Candidatus Polarisedimenticolia bacterium]|nr:LysR family transcriptional regulator [Candidatus Polarisedimenticolia bacterium]